MSTIINVGLAVSDGTTIAPAQVRAALEALGVTVLAREVRQSVTEPTYIASLERPLTPVEADWLSTVLRREAVAQKVDGVGELYGPGAAQWRPFNPEFFLDI